MSDPDAVSIVRRLTVHACFEMVATAISELEDDLRVAQDTCMVHRAAGALSEMERLLDAMQAYAGEPEEQLHRE